MTRTYRISWPPKAIAILQAENEQLKGVLAAAGITGWVTAPDGSVEPHYDTDEEEDVRNEPSEVERLRVLAVHDAELYHDQNHSGAFRQCHIVVCSERRVVLHEIRVARAALEVK